jgi:hypothetical protein
MTWNAHVCNAEYTTLTVGTLSGDRSAIEPVKLRRADSRTQTLMSSSRNMFANSSVFPNQGYEVTFNGGTPLRSALCTAQGSRPLGAPESRLPRYAEGYQTGLRPR